MVCEGAVTEPEYLRGYRRWARNAAVEVEIAKDHGVPLTVVQIAKRLKDAAEAEARRTRDRFSTYDEVWCVFDVDEHPNLNEARQLAQANQIRLAVSNPCFELWLVLHFRDSPGARHRHEVQRMVRMHLPDYDKHLGFADLQERVADAERRAEALDRDAQQMAEAGRNPTTNVYELTRAIVAPAGG